MSGERTIRDTEASPPTRQQEEDVDAAEQPRRR
jgi:hypothetical protein